MEELNKTIRLKTKPGGDDKHLKVKLEQSFDFLEVLSLKISQEDLYADFCSNYGVVVGRVLANQGFGVPNSKVSIFIPITDEDEKNELIKDLYPYKSLTDKNNEGYRYNLLLNTTTCDLNVPTGTFPDKETLLSNEVIIEVFEKYYKYTTKTNESGDFMLFGVPVGPRIIHMDTDLSDCGLLSSRPYDLISQGAPLGFFDGYTKFKTSKNLDTLVQIKSSNQSVDVIPFWGKPENCEIGITRVDIDTNVVLEPTALFTGSIFSDNEKNSINKRCNPRNDMGELTELRTGAGTINFIRAKEVNIVEWVQNKKIVPTELEFFDINGGDLIDDDGTFVTTLPMNIGRVVTNEVGDLVPSEDPEIGLPTKALYRMKMSFNEPPSNRKRRTANMIFPSLGVPHGGTPGFTTDGHTDNIGGTEDQRFTDDISDYKTDDLNFASSSGNSILKDFHLFEWKQLYTIAQYIKKYKKGNSRWSFLGLKNTDADGAANNVMPFNTAVKKPDFLFGLGSFFLQIGAAFIRMIIIMMTLSFGFYIGFNLSFTIFGTPFCLVRFYSIIAFRPFGWLGNIMSQFCDDEEDSYCCIQYGPNSRGFSLSCADEEYCIHTNPDSGSVCGDDNGPPCGGTANCDDGIDCTPPSSPDISGIISIKEVCGCPDDTLALPADATCNDPVLCLKAFSFVANENNCGALDVLEKWLCCRIIELAEKRQVIRRCFFDAWITGTAYLFQYKYKSKLKKQSGELVKKEKFCGPGADTRSSDNYRSNQCCPHDNNTPKRCENCLIRGSETTDGNYSTNFINYHKHWHNKTVLGNCDGYSCGNGATDIDDNIYCNAYNSTKIVSLGRIEMCGDTLNEIENCINKSSCVFDLYKQNPQFFPGTFYEDGWDPNFWFNDIGITSYQDPIDVLKYLIDATGCNVSALFDRGSGCHENELKNQNYQYVKEISKIYTEIITGQVDQSIDSDFFAPGTPTLVEDPSNPGFFITDEDDDGPIISGFNFDNKLGQRFSPCGGGNLSTCNQPPNPWSGEDTQENSDATALGGILLGPSELNNASKNIPYYYFGLNPGKTAIEKLRNKFFLN